MDRPTVKPPVVKLLIPSVTLGMGLVACLLSSLYAHAQDIAIPERRAPRWLELSDMSGEVTFSQGSTNSRPAQLQQRLEREGDRLSTGEASSAVLTFDTDIGQIRLSNSTIVEITTLSTSANGGQVTHLAVPQGTASLQIRRFNNPTSALEVETPAGVAAVRGTEFGVGISGSGKTAVATTEGAVATTAAGETVLISSGFYTTVIPGEPPASPRSLADSNLWLELEPLQREEAELRVSGRIFPANSLLINGLSFEIDRDGNFTGTVPLEGESLEAVVQSPLGSQATYMIAIAIDGWQLYQSENFREAATVFTDRLRLNPRDWDALLGLGFVSYAEGDFDTARTYLVQVQAALPDSVAALAGLGLVAAASNDPDRARELWQEALRRDPTNTTIQGYLNDL